MNIVILLVSRKLYQGTPKKIASAEIVANGAVLPFKNLLSKKKF